MIGAGEVAVEAIKPAPFDPLVLPAAGLLCVVTLTGLEPVAFSSGG